MHQLLQSSDCPDLIAHIFRAKLRILINLIKKNEVLGKHVAHVHTIEFQKCNMPHAHILIFVNSANCLCTPEQVDALILAEISDSLEYPWLYRLVTSTMIYNLCGAQNPKASCIKDRKYSKHFPRQFQTTTSLTKDGYPTYCQRENGHTFIKPDS
jgi:hypothetical protein